MNRLCDWVARHFRLTLLLNLLLCTALGGLATFWLSERQADVRASALQTETERQAVRLMSLTLNGHLMGAVTMLGLVDDDIRADVQGKTPLNTGRAIRVLESVGQLYAAQGVLLVNHAGIVRSAWDSAGKSSSGWDVQFRPYFQRAMQGQENVYAAISLARGERALYFAAPVRQSHNSDPSSSPLTQGAMANALPLGVAAARTDLSQVDRLLAEKGDIALLISPQGVVFASSRPAWIGRLLGEPTAVRLKAIRDLKQFGSLFEGKVPEKLPIQEQARQAQVDAQNYLVARAALNWNDPAGDWMLMLLQSQDVAEDVHSRSVFGFLVFALSALLLFLLSNILRARCRGEETGKALAAYAEAQKIGMAQKSRLAETAVRLQQAKTPGLLAEVFLSEMHTLFGALQGVIYADALTQGRHRCLGRFACEPRVPDEIRPGEGLLGACLIEKRLQVYRAGTQDVAFTLIASGLGHAPAAALLVAPVKLNTQLLGVVELAFLVPPTPEQCAQIEELLFLLAMNLEIVIRNRRTEELLSAALGAEKKLNSQSQFQQVLIDTIPYPVFYKGADTRFLGFNKAYEDTFGVQRDSLIGKRVLDLTYLPEADRQAYQAEDEATIATVGQVKREMQIPFADGQRHDTLYFVSGFRLPDGTPGGLVGTFIDISELRTAERELALLTAQRSAAGKELLP